MKGFVGFVKTSSLTETDREQSKRPACMLFGWPALFHSFCSTVATYPYFSLRPGTWPLQHIRNWVSFSECFSTLWYYPGFFCARFKKTRGQQNSKNLHPLKKTQGPFWTKNSVCWSQLEISTKKLKKCWPFEANSNWFYDKTIRIFQVFW